MRIGRSDDQQLVSGDDVVCLFLLTELVTIVLRLSFGGFANQRRRCRGSNQRTVHRIEREIHRTHLLRRAWEGVHQDVVLCLENKHVVESTRDTKRHRIRERTLTERIDKEDCRCCCNRCRISNTDPRTHTEAVESSHSRPM